MKSLIYKIAKTDIAIKLRNLIGFRPVKVILNKKIGFQSISDAFLWRTDNGFKTTFNYADILGLFYKVEDSHVELNFYSKNNDFIKKIIINQLNYSNELLIDKDFLDGIEDYGVFYIFHRYGNYSGDDLIIANRCYVGFSLKDSLSSFVHGNQFVRYQSLDGKYDGSDMVKSSFFNNRYRIQNSFLYFTKSELFFVNPTSKKIDFSIGNIRHRLGKNCSIIIDIGSKENITISSRCMMLRPVIFNYKDDFFDVYHA